MRPLILHLSGDYPDPVRNRTTFAVKNFIDRLDDCDHLIISLKRRTNPFGLYCRAFRRQGNTQVVALAYWAPPGGLFHLSIMRELTDLVAHVVKVLGVRPDFVMAHKLTIEGVVAHELWKRTGTPYACSVRGEVEHKFFRYKPLLRRYFGGVIRNAEALYFVSAWFEKVVAQRYPGLARRQSRLPNFPTDPIVPSWGAWEPGALLSVFDVNMYRRKGFPSLLAALALARKTDPALRLDVIGWSRPGVMSTVRNLVAKAGVADAVHFLGAMPRSAVLSRMPRYAALALPAVNETFGMVYVEALMSGVPILHTRDSGVDGYLDGLDVGVDVRAGDVQAIAQGLIRLAADAPKFRAALRDCHEMVCERFAPDACLADFRRMLAEARHRPAPAPRLRSAVSMLEENNGLTRDIRA